MSSARRGLATTLLLLLAACSQRDTEAQQSAGRVARAIEVLRNAPNDGKGSALQALAVLPCQGPDVCETREACRSAYALHVDSVNLTAAARQKAVDGHDAEAANLLGRAQQLLQDAGSKVQDCIERESALRRRYKL